MAKYICSACDYETVKWFGKCPNCNSFNTLEESIEIKVKQKGKNNSISVFSENSNKFVKFDEIVLEEVQDRIKTDSNEFNSVLGGGIVRGSLTLIGGDPGIGKSTLLLQISINLSDKYKVFYVSGEESLSQLKMRAIRVSKTSRELYFMSETNMDIISAEILRYKPDILIIDSIQTMYDPSNSSSSGSISQIKDITNICMKFSKINNISTFIVGHVTKDGNVAGPKLLEHMVDTVMYFEGNTNNTYRILRTIKNRFGPTNEMAVFEMKETGLSEVKNPSEYMLRGRPNNQSGSVICPVLEGTRVILVEIQALVCRTNFNFPRRSSVGIDYNKMNILLAVLEKRLNLDLSVADAYLNVVGGLKLEEPAIDLAVIIAIYSSYKDIVIDNNTVFLGEVGLSGEVRTVTFLEKRISEAIKMGFTRIVIPNEKVSFTKNVDIIMVNTVFDAIKILKKKE